VELYGLAIFATAFMLGILWIVESLEPEQLKLFDLKVAVPDPSAVRAGIENILRRSGVKFELRSAGAKDLMYETQLPLSVRTDRIANAILLLEPGGETEVSWEEKKKK
jgi:hypothetical protein